MSMPKPAALLTLSVLLLLAGCDNSVVAPPGGPAASNGGGANPEGGVATGDETGGVSPAPHAPSPSIATTPSLKKAREGFKTRIVRRGDSHGAPDQPPGRVFELIRYDAPVGKLAAYVTKDPGDGRKRPAIVWITGGDCNSIGDVWSSSPRSNDQSASAFRKAGVVMMFPSQRGGNNNPGQREGFYGELDDILAATDHLASLPYVDADNIYLGGHSTGGTMVMLMGAYSHRYKAIFSLGPVASPAQYGGDFMYCDTNNDKEVQLRSPLFWLDGVQTPMYVLEGGNRGNWSAIQMMASRNRNDRIKFLKAPRHDHFSVIAPVAELLAKQIIQGDVNITETMVQRLR